MSMNQTPSGERVHIAFFGRRNAGKSSLVNAVTGQDLAIVSDVRGTTTDPVYKAMELLPLGPVVMIDTPGIDDEGELGQQRVRKTRQVLAKADIAILVVDATVGRGDWEEEMLRLFAEKKIPFLIVYNKGDLLEKTKLGDGIFGEKMEAGQEIFVSARTGAGIQEMKERMARLLDGRGNDRRLVADLVKTSEVAVLVVPIDKAAPKGRLILPQQQVIRELLDAGAAALVCREKELAGILEGLGRDPALVITDSQVFPQVARLTPTHIRLTSFSILFARYKGNLAQAVSGARTLKEVEDGDRILISEGCTHHRQCGDIGSVKLPAWIREFTGKELEFHFTSGTEFPEDVSEYRLIVHCGGCMLNEREMQSRLRTADEQAIPMTNYGILIAYMKGILERSIEGFGL
ncbi:MAG: [FeFe] hydrogenase H-cluster maturation GTPase HydF [Clostridium sp.]|jgi:[FeFe] hydrogenase H-cluster maturation GTPase HydF